jgi:REP element-mobilizing transposase RayT
MIRSNTTVYHRYHVVWATKYRHGVLQGARRERLREVIGQTCSELDVQIIKGRSSRRVQMEFTDLRKRYWVGDFGPVDIFRQLQEMSPTTSSKGEAKLSLMVDSLMM